MLLSLYRRMTLNQEGGVARVRGMQASLSGLLQEPSSRLSGSGESWGRSGELLSTCGWIAGGRVAFYSILLVVDYFGELSLFLSTSHVRAAGPPPPELLTGGPTRRF